MENAAGSADCPGVRGWNRRRHGAMFCLGWHARTLGVDGGKNWAA